MRYVAPSTLEEASAFLVDANGNGRVLAGGTDLLVQLRAGMANPDTIVDVKHIDELMTIKEEADGMRIGAAVCGQAIGEHAGLNNAWPGLVEATELIGSTQVQGRASAGGNLCNASPAADSVPAMIAAGAMVTVYGPDGHRELAVENFATAPGKTNLKEGELITSIKLPKPAERSGDAYLRMTPRTEMDIAIVGLGVALTLDGEGTVTAARVGLGAVAPTAMLVKEAGDALVGSKLDDVALERAAEACRKACNPINDKRGTIEYRTKIAGVLLKRVAKIAAERAGS